MALADPYRLFQLGQRGIDIVNKPQDLDESELVRAQNAEISTSGGQGGLDQRPGMTRINVAPLNGGAPLASALDVPASLLTDYTPTLYVSLNDGTWRKSTDGATWTTVSLGIRNFSGFTAIGSWRQWPKIITVGRQMYFIGQVTTQGTSRIPVYSYDGTTVQLISYVPPAIAGTFLSTPVAPTVGQNGTPGVVTYSYLVVAKFSSNHSAASATGSFALASSPQSPSAYTIVTPASPPVPGATSYDVYRTAGGTGATGVVGSIPIVAGAFTLGNGSGLQPSTYIFTDAGLTGDGTTAPSTGSGTQAAAGVQVIDMVTDGTYIYMAVIDNLPGDPTVDGRILQFDPKSVQWQQIGANFPINANGNGSAGCLGFFDGALNYGTYIGTTSGATGYITSTLNPLPAGGVIEVKATATAILPTALQMFNGLLYVSKVSLAASGTSAVVSQRGPLTTNWSDVLTSSGNASFNAFTNLAVYNGRLYTGWFSGNAATAAFIKSSADGSTWTTEITLDQNEMPCQTVIFNNELYWVLGKTSANTLSRVIKRTVGGTWSTVDTGFSYTGAIGIVYQ